MARVAQAVVAAAQADESRWRYLIGRRGRKITARLAMSQEDDLPKPTRVPFFQRLLDNPFLLLFLGVTMPTVFYIMWGIMEIATIPVAP